jgi:hypothetical protein
VASLRPGAELSIVYELRTEPYENQPALGLSADLG